MRNFLNIFTILTLLTLIVGLPDTANSQNNLVIRRIKFKGNKTLLNNNLKEQLTIKQSSKLSRKYLNKEGFYYSQELYKEEIERLKHYYQKEGFLTVKFLKPEIKEKKQKLILTFNIDESEYFLVDSIKFTTNGSNGIKNLMKNADIRFIRNSALAYTNERFRDEDITADQSMILKQYKQAGYPYVEAIPNIKADTLTKKASVTWEIETGPLCKFGDIIVSGNEKVKLRNINRQLIFEESERYSEKKISESQRQIYNLGMFRVASVRTILTKEKRDTIPIRIVVQEAPAFSSRFGVGYGKEEKFRASADFQYLGFLGGTRRVNFLVKHSSLEPYNIDFRFTQPAFISTKGSAIINPYLLKQVEPSYTVEKLGSNLTYAHEITKDINGSFTFFYEEVNQDTVQSANITEFINTKDDLYNKSGILLAFVFNNSKPRFDPVNGISLSAQLKTNGILRSTSYPFHRTLYEFKYYKALNPRLTLASKIKAGRIINLSSTDIVPVDERFYAGGSNSVRGWGRSQLGPKDETGIPTGGNNLFEASIEPRLSLNSFLIAAFFIDCGNVWDGSFFNNISSVRFAAGSGIRIKTPIGPAGIDVARPIFDSDKKWQLHFNIGHPF